MPATIEGPDFTIFASEEKNLAYVVGVDITGAAIVWTLIEANFNRTADIVKGGTITGAATGAFTISLTAEETAILSGEYAYICIVTDAATDITTTVTGSLIVQTYTQELSYCSIFDVRTRCQQLTIDATSSPSEASVFRLILATYHEINAALLAAGYAVPIPVEASTLNAGASGIIVVSGSHTNGNSTATLTGSGGSLVGAAASGDHFTVTGDNTRYHVVEEARTTSDGEIVLSVAPRLRMDAADGAVISYHSSRGSHELLRTLNADGAAARVLLSAFGNGGGQVGEDQIAYGKIYRDNLKMLTSGSLKLSGIARTERGGLNLTPLRRI